MKVNEDIYVLLYMKEHMFIGPISFYAGTVIEWFFEWDLFGIDWLLVGTIEGVCFCDCISVLGYYDGVNNWLCWAVQRSWGGNCIRTPLIGMHISLRSILRPLEWDNDLLCISTPSLGKYII